MTLSVIISPFDGDKAHAEYTKRAMLDSIKRKETPVSDHALYSQALLYDDPSQRKQATNLGYNWGKLADSIAVYTDYGITKDMQEMMSVYHRLNKPIEYRKIGKNVETPISVVVFKWKKDGYRSKFSSEHVNIFFKMLRRNTTLKYTAFCVTDDPAGIDQDIKTVKLWENPCPRYAAQNTDKPNCFYRLKMFDPEIGKLFGEKFIWFDLDAVIVGNIDHILTDPSDFKMWRVDNEFMPVNGSMCMNRVGTKSNLWHEFNPQRVHPVTGLQATGFIGSDQAFIASKITEKEKNNMWGKADGIYSYRCHLLKTDPSNLPEDAKIVMFHGRHDPWDNEAQKQSPWIKQFYSL